MKSELMRIAAFAVTAALILHTTAMPLGTIPVFAEQTGISAQAEETVHISTVEEFLEFSSDCVYDKYSRNKKFVLDCDIDLRGTGFMPVPVFCGEFDGKGHRISNLKISGDCSDTGLFRHLEAGAVIKDLKVYGEILPSGTAKICGGIVGSNRGQIVNCSFSGAVKGKEYIGGIAGSNEETGIIISCASMGIVNADHFTGGIAGQNIGIIINCENLSAVNTEFEDGSFSIDDINIEEIGLTEHSNDITDAGGITGFSSGTIQNCVNKGRIGYRHVGYNIGGTAGRQSGYISGCSNYGEINGRKDTGGIVGQAEPYESIFFSAKKLDELRNRLNSLSDSLDTAINHIENRSDISSDDINEIVDGLTEIKNSADDFLDETDRVINADIDAVNEISLRISDLSEMLSPAADSFSSAADSLVPAMRNFSEAADELKKAAEYSDEGLDELVFITDDLTSAMDNIRKASENIEKSLDALQRALGDPYEMQNALTRLSDSFDNMGNALNALAHSASKILKNTEAYLKDIASEADAVRLEIAEALRDIAESSEKLAKCFRRIGECIKNIGGNISAGSTDPMYYLSYIKNIAESFDADAAAEMLGSFSDFFEALYESAAGELRGKYNRIITSAGRKHNINFSGDIEENLEKTGKASEELFGAVSDIIGETDALSFDDMIEYLKKADINAGNSAENIRDVFTAMGYAADDFDDAFYSAMAAVTKISEASDSITDAAENFSDSIEIISDTFDYYSSLENIEFTGADSGLADSRRLIGDSTGKLLDALRGTSENAGFTSDIIGDDFHIINNKARDAYNTLIDIIDDISNKSSKPEDYRDDISALDDGGRSDGKVAYCKNYGNVNGDVNVGGIAGTMAVELDFDPEGDIEISGERSGDFMYKSKTVTRDCVNYGNVTSKKDCAGGIAGSIETGCIMYCTSYGFITSEDGGYVGGTAGKSDAAVNKCRSMVHLSGGNYVGGISGTAKKMTDCVSFSVIIKSGEHSGAVAGYADMYSGYEIYGNVFVDAASPNGTRPEGAIDGISYTGRAFPVPFEEMAEKYDVPREFKELELTFTADGKVVDKVNFSYGGSVSEADIPDIPAKSGYFSEWADFDYSNLTFSEEIEAIYSKYLTSIASDEKRGDSKPMFVVEGLFTNKEKLSVTYGNGKHDLEIPETESENPVFTVRYLPQGNIEKIHLNITEDGMPSVAEVTRDGSYFVFKVTGHSISVTESENTSDLPLIIICSSAGLIIIITAGCVSHSRRKKKKSPLN